MPHPMSAAILKIGRARKHIAELEQIIQTYVESDPIKYETSVEAEQIGTLSDGKRQMRAIVSFNFKQEAMPEETSAILGDIFHNLRSALDLMATELCRAEDDPDDQTHFPFAKKEDDFEKRLKETRFNRAGPEALKLMREIKPYPGGNDMLRAIHDLDIRDKHKRLIINALSFATPVIDLGPEEKRHAVPKIVGDPAKPSALTFLFPPDTQLANHELIPTLHQLAEVTEGIVERFKLLRASARNEGGV